jgi:hypothetical protein
VPASPKSNPDRQPLDLLDQIANLAGAVLADNPSEGDVSTAGTECLAGLLETLRALLAAVPEAYTLRQLLVQMIGRLPVKAYLDEPRADLIRQLKKRSLSLVIGGQRIDDALDQSCSWWASQISSAHFRISGRMAEITAQLEQVIEASETLGQRDQIADGPTAGGLMWHGNEYRFGPQQLRLLQLLWDHPDGRDEEEIRTELQIKSNALSQLQHKTQARLDAYRLPFKLRRPRPLMLCLERLPLTKR